VRVNQKVTSLTKNPGSWLIVEIYADELVALSDLSKKRPTRPFVKPMGDLIQSMARKELEIVDHEFPAEMYLADTSLPAPALEKRDAALEALRPIIEDNDRRFRYLFTDPSGVLADLIQQSGRSKKYVATCLNRYFAFGSMPNALLPHYFNCGMNTHLPKQPRFLDDGSVCMKSKRGRKTRYGERYRGITQADIDNIRHFVKTKIPSGQKLFMPALYKAFCKHYCTTEITLKTEGDDRASSMRVLNPPNYRISPRSFARILKQLLPTIDWIKKERGSKAYDSNHAGKPGVAREGLRGPTSRYEIDSTELDIYIRYPYTNDKRLATGRPSLYLVVDVMSGMIVGMHLSFYAPSWFGALQALFNAMSDKVEFCAKYGVSIEREDWPCHHACSEITFDRGGENTDNHLAGPVKAWTGISTVNVNPVHRGDLKGTVEVSFDSVQSTSIEFEAGKVVKVPEKSAQHASRKALYSLDEFMQILINAIIEKNKFQIRPDTHNFEMSRDDVGFTPQDIWTWGLENAVIPNEISKDRLRMAFLPEKKASVTDKGILFRGLYYSGDFALTQRWFDIAKNEGRFNIPVRYLDSSTNHIWYQDPNTRKIIQFDLTTRSEAHKNRYWAEVLHRLEIVKDKVARTREARLAYQTGFSLSLDEYEEAIRSKTRHLTSSPAKSVERGMRERKQVEAAVARQKETEEITRDLASASQSQGSPTRRPTQQNLDDPNVIPVEDDF
jgi:putative transposase